MGNLFFLWSILLFSSVVSSLEPPKPDYADLQKKKDDLYCGPSQITSKLEYCTVYRKCDRAGIIDKATNLDYQNSQKSGRRDSGFVVCDKNSRMDSYVEIRVNRFPDVWKRVKSVYCIKKGDNATIDVEFENKDLKFSQPTIDNKTYMSYFAFRCISGKEGSRARFDIYHYNELEQKKNQDNNEGVLKSERLYLVHTFIALLVTLTGMAVYYAVYLYFENQKLAKKVTRAQTRHDEMWLSIERAERERYNLEEVWNAMPLVHQQVAVEAAVFLQKYKGEKFLPQLRQWIIDRGYPAGATEIIIELAGLADSDFPFYAPVERKSGEYTNVNKIEEFSARVEARLVDTLNYANRLRRRKIVFTDHRWLELHHLIFELLLTCLGSPSHPTLHDAPIPILPRHAFGTRDDPREEEKEEKEREARKRRPHFLHHDWDEAQRLLGSEA